MNADEYFEQHPVPDFQFDNRRRSRAICPVCGEMTPLRKDGSFHVHTTKSGPYDRVERREFCSNDKHKETNDVTTRENEDVIRRRIERLERELIRLESLPKDDFEDGAVISFDKNFGVGNATPFSYVAIKCGGKWFVTGRTSGGANMNGGRTWNALMEFIQSGVNEMPTIYYVTEWSTL